MAKRKYDYESEEFLKRIEEYAKKGYADKEIAYELGLDPTTFSEYKTTKYTLIEKALARGRAKINNIVRQRFLAVGLGGIKVKTVTKQKPKFSDTDEGLSDMVVHETETELPPNLSALGTWLFNHDEEWRQKTIEGKKLDVTTNGKDVNATPLVFMSASEMDKDLLDDIIKSQLGGDDRDADSGNDTGS